MPSDGSDWQPPAAEVELGDGAVHVWRVALDVPESTVLRLYAVLDARERARADRQRSKDLRRRFVVSHGMLRGVLARTLGGAPESLCFVENPNGKPELAGSTDDHDALRFNLSHSHEVALCALTRGRRLGVDVERIRDMRDLGQVAERFFCESEERALATVSERDRRRVFFDAWTRKEAFIKARGETVFGWLRRFEVSLLPGEEVRIVRVDDDAEEAARWSLHALAPRPDYTGALAVEGHGHGLHLFRWP